MYSKKRGITRKNILNLCNINNKIQLIPQKEIEIKEEEPNMNMGNKGEIYLNEYIGNKNSHRNLR
jgi:hypothetical protein